MVKKEFLEMLDLSEMVDSRGNYVRTEESPSGNSKYGVTDGAENSGRAGKPMGPEGLSEGDNPFAHAKPTLLLFSSISKTSCEVNGEASMRVRSYPSFST